MKKSSILITNFKKYILANKWAQLQIPTNLCISIIKHYLVILTLNYISVLSKLSSNYSKNAYHLIYFIIFSLLAMALELYNGYFKNILETQIIWKSYTDIYNSFINTNHAEWKTIADKEIYFSIIRVAQAIASFLSCISYCMIDTLIFLVIAFIKISFTDAKNVMTTLIIIVIAYFTLYSICQFFRSKCRIMMSKYFDKVSAKASSMFLNYELIHAYDMIDFELQGYCIECEHFLFWSRISWLSNCLISLLTVFLTLFMKIFILEKSLSSFEKSSLEIIKLQHIFSSIKSSMFATCNEINQIISNVPNIVYNKLDSLTIINESAKIQKFSYDKVIELSGVSCDFGTQQVLSNINLTIKKGDKIAITGANGSGKSSFIKMLLGLYKLDGSAKIDSVPLENISSESLSRLISYIPQESLLFNASIIDNLRCFDEKITDDMVIKWCTDFGLHDEFKLIGYSTVVEEHGGNLSAIQQQKISFMRAVIRDCPIIIIDELTAEMADALEQEFIDRILSQLANKTVIMIIHKLEKLCYFDRVVYFNNGSATDGGNFNNMCIECNEFLDYYNMNAKN